MTETLLLMLYGGIVIASGFLVGSSGRLALVELVREGPRKALRSTFFWIAANLWAQAIALMIICFFRTVDGLRGVSLSGSWGWPLVLGFALLLASKIGFNWTATATLKHGRITWWSIMLSLFLWFAFVAGRYFLVQ
jgi:hypothetical protein